MSDYLKVGKAVVVAGYGVPVILALGRGRQED